MKKMTTTLLFTFAGLLAFSQTNADIVGQWYNAKKDAVITLFEENETVSGKITWMQFPNDDNGNLKKGPLNPDEKLKFRVRIDMLMISSFPFTGRSSTWIRKLN